MCTEIRRTNDFLASLEQIEAENTDSVTRVRGATPSARCFCTKASRSSPPTRTSSFSSSPARRSRACMCSTSGPNSRTSGARRMGVVADMPSTHNLLIKLEQFGHKFLAHFHSHPGKRRRTPRSLRAPMRTSSSGLRRPAMWR